MIDASARLASRNLVRTYFELGLAAPGARKLVDEGFQACVGPLGHPICNFASSLHLQASSATRLHDLAEGRSAFHVYRLPIDEPAEVGDLLGRAGFELGYRLTMMVATSEAGEPTQMTRTPDERRPTVARFMADQFFLRQTPEFRRQIATTTAAAASLELYHLTDQSGIVAGVMLCRAEGACGLYNLCVAPDHRGNGVGSSLVRGVLAMAHDSGEAVTLQCESRLEPWYAALGFRSCGKVEVFCLP